MPLTPKQQLHAIDDGRFSDLLSTLEIDDECFKCGSFVIGKTEFYRCACLGTCIGETLSDRLKDYLTSKIST